MTDPLILARFPDLFGPPPPVRAAGRIIRTAAAVVTIFTVAATISPRFHSKDS
ncbi:hypothetical protein [Sphingomonas oligophenolica]|uniref:hypothetical protein n=1 Tax=Sphingomonas oligophenolica TaxID=301154 RepID=UPI0013875554|nr:hypothetical protein [Sphingomonas oligophenolica]